MFAFFEVVFFEDALHTNLSLSDTHQVACPNREIYPGKITKIWQEKRRGNIRGAFVDEIVWSSQLPTIAKTDPTTSNNKNVTFRRKGYIGDGTKNDGKAEIKHR